MSKNNRVNFLLFILAESLTFSFITLLQVTEYPVFLIMLLFMHTGIVLFVVSKKRFTKNKVDVKRFYLFEYGLLSTYLPLLAYTLLSYLFLYEVNETVKVTIALVLTLINVMLSVVNTVKLKKQLQNN